MRVFVLLLIFVGLGFSKSIDFVLENSGNTKIKAVLIITDKEEFIVGDIEPNSKDTVTLPFSNESIIRIDYEDIATNPNEIIIECIENSESDYIVNVDLFSSDAVCIIKE